MYIALLLMLAGIIAGRICRRHVSHRILAPLIFCSILFLLFLLGAQIGVNERLFANLPSLGGDAMILMALCVAGSIAAVKVIMSLAGSAQDKNER